MRTGINVNSERLAYGSEQLDQGCLCLVMYSTDSVNGQPRP